MELVNIEQAEYWATVAPTWIEVEDRLNEVIELPGEMAMDRLGLRPGERVLDLGCGTGRTTLRLAERVAPGGQAVGVDITEEMVARARRHAALASGLHVEFVVADVVQALDFGPDRFDAAYSRFGVLFCSDPDEPGPFSLSDPERVRTVLSAAGFVDVDVQPYGDFFTAPRDRVRDLALTAMRVGVARELLRGQPEEIAARVRAAIEEALAAKVEGDEVRLSRAVLVVTAAAPS
jgi:SAM-dependent methyltransferase